MRSRPILLLPVLLLSLSCASTTPGSPGPTPDISCAGCPGAPSWANCNPGGCGYVQPTSPTGQPPLNPPPDPTCDGGYGRQCEDGQPPVAIPSPFACTLPGSTPCGLGAAAPGQIQFAVIGDWGDNCCRPSCANFVAEMIQGWSERWPLDFIMTTGDNFYPDGGQAALAASMPMYDWIGPQPVAGDTPRFFPTLGNHDLYDGCCGNAYQTYFQALGAGSPTGTPRYYKYSLPGGLIDLYSLNADASEPDGNTEDSIQAMWLKEELAKPGGAQWKIVFFHEPPFTTHSSGASPNMDWPFAQWGATVVLTGHVHAYERIVRDDFTYVVNGIGGVKGVDYISEANGCTPIEGSVVQYNGSVGAMIGVATADELRFCLLAVDRDHPDGICVDNFSFRR